jgi:hypothetical protein
MLDFPEVDNEVCLLSDQHGTPCRRLHGLQPGPHTGSGAANIHRRSHRYRVRFECVACPTLAVTCHRERNIVSLMTQLSGLPRKSIQLKPWLPSPPLRIDSTAGFGSALTSGGGPATIRRVWQIVQVDWRDLLVTSGLGSARMDSCYRVIRRQRIERTHEL